MFSPKFFQPGAIGRLVVTNGGDRDPGASMGAHPMLQAELGFVMEL